MSTRWLESTRINITRARALCITLVRPVRSQPALPAPLPLGGGSQKREIQQESA